VPAGREVPRDGLEHHGRYKVFLGMAAGVGKTYRMLQEGQAEALAGRTVNVAEWCGHLLERLHRQCEATADPELIKLYHELKAYPMPARSAPLPADNVAIPFKFRFGGDVLSFMSATMIFGTPVDITLSEMALETFFPADDLTAERMRGMAASFK